MKFLWTFVFILALGSMARADILRLRDGQMVTGSFLGATRTEIWFQRDAPADFLGAVAYPVLQVESLTFGPSARQSSAGASPDFDPPQWLRHPARRAPGASAPGGGQKFVLKP